MDLDDLLTNIGEYGKYQKMVLWLILIPAVFPCGFHAYNQLFMAAVPEHWCYVPRLANVSVDVIKNSSLPLALKDGELKFSRCLMYDNDYNNISIYDNGSEYRKNKESVPCQDGWIYDKALYKETVVTEWNLVCDENLAPTLALILFGAGGLVGNYLFGYIQDGLGRKPAFFIYLFIQSFFGIATAFAPNFVIWTIFRVGVGFTVPAILGTPYVLAIELVGPRHRTSVTVLINIAYSLALVLLACVVWIFREWRILAIVTTIPFIFIFSYWWVLPESPRWLLSQGRFSEAEKIITHIARTNNKVLPPNYMIPLKQKIEDEKIKKEKARRYGVADLFITPNLRWKTVIITFIWFTNTSVYVGLSYYASALGGNAFLNFFLAAAVELPTYLFLWPALERCGRRWTLCVSMVIGGSACLTTFLVQNDFVVTLSLYCIGKMGISSGFVVLPLMASEIYPTVVRGLGMSISSVMGMIGPIIIPMINYLGSNVLALPLIIMGAMLVMGGACSLLLPETLNQHLPQTLEDGEKIGLDCFACCTPPQRERRTDIIGETSL